MNAFKQGHPLTPGFSPSRSAAYLVELPLSVSVPTKTFLSFIQQSNQDSFILGAAKKKETILERKRNHVSRNPYISRERRVLTRRNVARVR